MYRVHDVLLEWEKWMWLAFVVDLLTGFQPNPQEGVALWVDRFPDQYLSECCVSCIAGGCLYMQRVHR